MISSAESSRVLPTGARVKQLDNALGRLSGLVRRELVGPDQPPLSSRLTTHQRPTNPRSFSERRADQAGGRDAEGLSALEERGLETMQIDAQSIT